MRIAGEPQQSTIKPITNSQNPHRAAVASGVARHAKGALPAKSESSEHPPDVAVTSIATVVIHWGWNNLRPARCATHPLHRMCCVPCTRGHGWCIAQPQVHLTSVRTAGWCSHPSLPAMPTASAHVC
jgi:hypothetical protein